MNLSDIKPASAADIERQLFTARLRAALESCGYDGHSPTKLQREFNARAEKPITVHAARKWLMCEAIPTQPRIKVLADWLGAKADYLRFGAGDGVVTLNPNPIAPENVRLLADFARLDARDQRMFRKLVQVMAKEPREQKAA